ncbi:MAG: peptidoglycan DD-metalloendopeptidase family protein [Pseudomonadota bacterium]
MKHLIAAFCLICLAPMAAAQDPAREAMAQLAAAAAQLEAAESASDRVSALTETVAAYEAGLAAMRAGQRDIALREAEIATLLAAREEELAQLLGVLSTIGRTPQPVQQAHPGGPLATARAGMLVADVTPALQGQVDVLQGLLDEAQSLRSAREAAAQTLQDGLEGAQAARTALAQAVSNRTDLPRRFDADPVQTALMVASAETLGAFAAELATDAPDPATTLTPRGDLPLPVTGIVLPDDDSGRPGVRIAAPERALVMAPVAGTLLFQGPLLDYGTVAILEPAPDVMFIFAGLAEVFGTAGEVLQAGAPLGLLGADGPRNDGILTENATNLAGQGAQTLYLEVREGQNSTEVDAWFALE